MQLGVKKDSTRSREAYFLEFAKKFRRKVRVPRMLTGGFRSLDGMNAPLRDGALDLIGLGRSLAIEPDGPARLLRGEETRHQVRPLSTGMPFIDRRDVLEVTWYTRQMHRMARGRRPQPNEHALKSFLMDLGLGMFHSRRLRA